MDIHWSTTVAILCCICNKVSGYADARYETVQQPQDSVVPARFYKPIANVNYRRISSFVEPDLLVFGDFQDLLIITRSSPHHFRRRDAIRLTWGDISVYSRHGFGVVVIFIVGVSSDSSVHSLLMEEAAKHRDLLYADYKDTYSNLTIKDVIAFQYSQKYIRRFQYVSIAGDEVVVNVLGVLRQLRCPSSTPPAHDLRRVTFCYEFPCCTPVIRDNSSRYMIQNGVYEGTRYPPYCSGTFFVLPMPLVEEVYHMALDTPSFMPDDAWFGVIYEKLGIDIVDTHQHYAGISSYKKELRILEHIKLGWFHSHKIYVIILDYAYKSEDVAAKIIEVWFAYNNIEHSIWNEDSSSMWYSYKYVGFLVILSFLMILAKRKNVLSTFHCFSFACQVKNG